MVTGVGARHYYIQEKLIFKAKRLPHNHVYSWKHPHEELFLPIKQGGALNALYFKKGKSKGVVLFFHGQGSNLNTCGHRADHFLEKDYDFFVIDYRGFGKSSNGFREDWFLEDGQTAYNYLKTIYKESEITVYGQSLGTSIATYVASKNHPKRLVLEAPFYSMLAAAAYTKPYLPTWLIRFILKYPLETNVWIKHVPCPIYIFHGTHDEIIPYVHSQKLYNEIKDLKQIEFITLPDCGHNAMHHHPVYKQHFSRIF